LFSRGTLRPQHASVHAVTEPTQPTQSCVEPLSRAVAFLATSSPGTPAASTVNRSPRERSSLRSTRIVAARRRLPPRARSAGRTAARFRSTTLSSERPARAHVWGKQAERSEAVGGSPDLGLTDMGGRIYDPLAGRFMTPDPVMQAPYWSQGQNRYSYVFNDPINSTDPSGFATQQNTASNALAVGTDPAVLSWGAVAIGAAVAQAGALSVGLSSLAGAGNVLATAAMNPFGGSKGGSYQVPSGSAAATSNGGGANAPIAVAQNRPPGPAAPATRRDTSLFGAFAQSAPAVPGVGPVPAPMPTIWYEATGELLYDFFVRTPRRLINGAYDLFMSLNSAPTPDELSAAGRVPDRGGYTKAGRSLQKHRIGGRPGSSKFPGVKGPPASWNAAGQDHLDDILTAPGSTTTPLGRGGLKVTHPDGRGARFNADGSFDGFVE
jgi:RHS repeat-associated protein